MAALFNGGIRRKIFWFKIAHKYWPDSRSKLLAPFSRFCNERIFAKLWAKETGKSCPKKFVNDVTWFHTDMVTAFAEHNVKLCVRKLPKSMRYVSLCVIFRWKSLSLEQLLSTAKMNKRKLFHQNQCCFFFAINALNLFGCQHSAIYLKKRTFAGLNSVPLATELI